MIGVPAPRSRVERAVQQVAQGEVDYLVIGGRLIRAGDGDPNGVVAGNPGELYMNRLGGDGTSFYVAEAAGTTWRAMQGSEILGSLLTIDQGTIVADVPVEDVTTTWNNAAVTFRGRVMRFIETARGVLSSYFVILGGASGTDEHHSFMPGTYRVTNLGTAIVEARTISDVASTNPNQRMRRHRGTAAAPTGALAGDYLGTTVFLGLATGAGATYTCVVATENHAAGTKGATYRIYTCKNGTNVPFPTAEFQGDVALLNGHVVGETRHTYLKVAHAIVQQPATAGATVTAAGLIPAGAVVVGVTTRVMTALGASGGTTGYRVGDGADADRWGAAAGVAAGTKTENANWTADTAPPIFLAAQDVVLTADGGNFDGTGVVAIDVAYLSGGAN